MTVRTFAFALAALLAMGCAASTEEPGTTGPLDRDPSQQPDEMPAPKETGSTPLQFSIPRECVNPILICSETSCHAGCPGDPGASY